MADRRSKGFGVDRIFLYAVLLCLAFLFLLPVYVMVVNSVKPLDEIRSGNLMALPIVWTISWSRLLLEPAAQRKPRARS